MNGVLTFSQQVSIFSMYQTVHVMQCNEDFIDNKKQDSIASSVGLRNRELASKSLQIEHF